MAQAASASVKTIKRDIPFVWEGMDKKGNRVKGKSLAPDEAALRSDLRRQGIAPSKVKKQSTAFKSGGKPSPEDIAVFSRQLATMLTAGIPLVQSFDIVGNGHEKPSMQKLILDIKMDVEVALRCMKHWPSTRCTSMICMSIWWKPASRPVRWKACWIRSRPTRKKLKR
jgi:type II secretory pathway component PulF